MSTDEPYVLGISASHNGATCLLRGDEIVAAVQEERLSRWKRHKLTPGSPFLGLDYCLGAAGIGVEALDAVVVCAQGHVTAPINDVTRNPQLSDPVRRGIISTLPHHTGHAISALAQSGFDDAAVLVVDGVGSPFEDLPAAERKVIVTAPAGHEMISLYAASGPELTPLEKHCVTRHLDRRQPGLPWFGTLGIMFGAIALQVFGNGLEAGKVMGLAPYGEPRYPVDEFFEIVDGKIVFNARVRERFPHGDRWPLRREEYQDLAASAQRALEEALLFLVARLRELSPSRNLCFAGGVALNSIANERIVREGGYDDTFIVPAAEDSGPAIGAAYHGLWQLRGRRQTARVTTDAVGRHYDRGSVERALASTPGIAYDVHDDAEDVARRTAELLAEGRIVGWFQGRSELGPRALGQRSILLDPRREDGKQILNSRIKFREAFRPFAPAILAEHADHWFELDGVDASSPFMLRVCRFREDKRDLVPAVVHVDGSGRVQTVTEANGPYHRLLRVFYELTSVPIVLNTSLNVMGEPIVETPEDALWCLLSTGLDRMVIGDVIVRKADEFSSLLDLVPTIRGTPAPGPGAAVPGQAAAGADATADAGADFGAERSNASDGYAHFEVPTVWGPARQRVATTYASVLPYIDGIRDGNRIRAAMSRDAGAVNDKFVHTAIARLRRARVISFVS